MPRIGVALGIPEPWAGELQDYRTSVGDLSAPTIGTHITLIGPLDVEDQSLARVEAHLTSAAAGIAPFDVRLQGTGTFRPVSPVAFVCLVEGISQCARLAQRVRGGPLAIEPTFPYHPHVTIAQQVPDQQLDQALAGLAGFECAFSVDEFSLYVHGEERGWTHTSTFALTGGY